MKQNYGDLLAQVVSGRIGQPAANAADLASWPVFGRVDGMQVLKTDDQSTWAFVAASSATDASNQLAIAPTVGAGAWMRIDRAATLLLPVTFNNADASAILTIPTGCRLHIRESWWDVSVGWTGGASSAIGVSTSVAGYNTKGDILGGATGDVAATLVTPVGRMVGTIGAKLTTRTADRLILVAGDVVRFDRITSAFTAGAANVALLCDLITNPGV